MEQVQKLYPTDTVSSPDNKRTMTPVESFESDVASMDYAINALSHPSDDTYRKNLARYLNTKGYDLVSKDRQLYIGDRNSMNTRPVTKSFIGDMIGSSPEIAGSILGATVGTKVAGPVGTVVGAIGGAIAGDSVQQMINNYFLGEELTGGERVKEVAKSGGLALGGEVAGNVIGRTITPLRDFSKKVYNDNTALGAKHGVELTPATATGHRGLSSFEEVMSKGSLGGQAIARAKEAEITGIENVANDLLENRMGATGNTHNSGASLAYNVNKQQELGKEYFEQVYKDLVEKAGVTEIPLTNLKNMALEMLDKVKKDPALKGTLPIGFLDEIVSNQGKISYETFGELRSLIGSKINDKTVTGGSGLKSAHKLLYKAINDDFDGVFKGQFANRKHAIDTQFKNQYKFPFEDGFTRGVTGTGKDKVDAERIGGLITNSSGKANTAANTADAGFGVKFSEPKSTDTLFDNSATRDLIYVKESDKPLKESMSTAADYLLSKSVAQDGGMSLPKMKTNLRKADGVDELFRIKQAREKPRAAHELGLAGSTMPVPKDSLAVMKDDIIELIQISGANNKVANQSGTAWMNELISMKNDPVKGIIGFASDQTISRVYKNKLFQKWLTNDVINNEQYLQLLNAGMQVGVRAGQE